MQPKTRVWIVIIVQTVLIGGALYSALFQDRFLWILLFSIAFTSVVSFFLLRNIVFNQSEPERKKFSFLKFFAYDSPWTVLIGGAVGMGLGLLYSYTSHGQIKWEVYAGISIATLAWATFLAFAKEKK